MNLTESLIVKHVEHKELGMGIAVSQNMVDGIDHIGLANSIKEILGNVKEETLNAILMAVQTNKKTEIVMGVCWDNPEARIPCISYFSPDDLEFVALGADAREDMIDPSEAVEFVKNYSSENEVDLSGLINSMNENYGLSDDQEEENDQEEEENAND